MDFYQEPPKKLPVSHYDVVIVGAGTGGVFAAVAAARNGAKTMVIEAKGYPGGTAVEGGTALHSFYNLWKPFERVEKRQVVRGIPQELIDRLVKMGGCSGHAEMERGYDYDSVSTGIDTELYKLAAFEMMSEAGVTCMMNTLMVDAIVEEGEIRGVIIENRGGRQAVMAKSFVDASGHGDLCAYAGAKFSEPKDYPSAHSIGIGGVDIDKYYDFIASHNAVRELAYGYRSGEADKIVRVGPYMDKTELSDGTVTDFPPELVAQARKDGIVFITTTVHDNYLMFIKVNYFIDASFTDMKAVNDAELLFRQKHVRAVELFRKYIPGCEKAFIARTNCCLQIRRGRLIECDYDMPLDEILAGKHYDDDVFTYGFHDFAPRLQIENGKTYGLPYRAMLVKGIKNLYATGMMITSDQDAHMSTRNTVSCMGMCQAAGTAAAICAKKGIGSRELDYKELRAALLEGGVYLENQE
jgi:hypothetical protein